MSNRTVYTRSSDDRQDLSIAARQKSKRRITGTLGQRSNAFRLSDIAKLIQGRHGGPCADKAWMVRYFRAALPHLVTSRELEISAGGWLQAVRTWVVRWVPMLLLERGEDWIEAEARACHAKRRRCPRIDRTVRMLKIEDHEPAAYGLRSLVSMSRPRAVRQAEDREKRRLRSQARRAKVPGHTARAESLAQTRPWEAAGKTRTAWYARRKAEREASQDPDSTTAGHLPDDCVPGDSAIWDDCVPYISDAGLGRFRARHLE